MEACVLPSEQLSTLETPHEFDRAVARVAVSDVCRAVRVSADIERHIAWIAEDLEIGYTRVYLHNVVRNHEWFFDRCAD